MPVMVTAPVRVVLADGHAMMRCGLRDVLDDGAGIEVVAEAGDLRAVRRTVAACLPRVLVIDLSMSNGSSIDTIRECRATVPGTEIVVITMEESGVFARETLSAGALGFVLKHAAAAELAPAVRSAARGERYVSPRVAAREPALEPSSEDALLRGVAEG